MAHKIYEPFLPNLVNDSKLIRMVAMPVISAPSITAKNPP
jgi:hypothetical protein